ncbi:MAG: (Fe-S)-binding protein [Thermodesulfobacteriota bacterium]
MSCVASVFIPCLMDAPHPDTARSVVTVLQRVGVSVKIPKAQSCCGQPAFNNGYRKEAAKVARHFLKTFASAQAIVCPSGSCVHMIRHEYPILFENDAQWLQLAEEIGKRTFELTEFLVDVLHVTDVGAYYPARATYHDSCHLARGLGIRSQPRELLSNVRELQWVEMKDSDRCCGFGGAFSIKYPEISTALCDDKIENIRNTGADTVIGCDMGCLMHISARVAKTGSPIHVRHIADILARTGRAP